MGCGIFFPPDNDSDNEDLSNEEEDVGRDDDVDEDGEREEAVLDGFLGLNDSDEEEELFEAIVRRPANRRLSKEKGKKVTVSGHNS